MGPVWEFGHTITQPQPWPRLEVLESQSNGCGGICDYDWNKKQYQDNPWVCLESLGNKNGQAKEEWGNALWE